VDTEEHARIDELLVEALEWLIADPDDQLARFNARLVLRNLALPPTKAKPRDTRVTRHDENGVTGRSANPLGVSTPVAFPPCRP
jgi:hypothetical protein